MYDSVWAMSTMGGNYGLVAERALGGGTVPSPPPTSEPSPPGGPLPQVSGPTLYHRVQYPVLHLPLNPPPQGDPFHRSVGLPGTIGYSTQSSTYL